MIDIMESHFDGSKENFQEIRDQLKNLQVYVKELFSFISLPVCNLDWAGNFTACNKAFEDLTLYSSSEIIGKPLESIFLDRQSVDNLLKEAREIGEIVRGKATLYTKQKQEINVRIDVSLRNGSAGNFVGYFVSVSDIREFTKIQGVLEKEVSERTAELEKTKEALTNMLEDAEEARWSAEEEKNRTLAIITNFTDGLLVFDKEGKLSLINPKAKEFFNVKEDEDLIGNSVPNLSKKPSFEPLVQLLGNNIKKISRKELSISKELVIEVSTVHIYREGEIAGELVILHDITREKMVERMKTEFVSISAHQLRTPLSAIKWTLKMLLDGDLGKISDEQREFIQKTYQSNERMIKLINDLLNVTRIEEGRYLYKPTMANIEDIVQSVIDSLKDELKRKNLEFEFKKPETKLPQIKVDVEKVSLAVQNLVENAIRYTKSGGKIIVVLSGDENEIKFKIKDTGIGISKEQQKRIFTKFFRATNAVRLETEGSGLGLYITKNIINAHGGKVWFESEEGKGTTFFFTLPVKKNVKEFLSEF